MGKVKSPTCPSTEVMLHEVSECLLLALESPRPFSQEGLILNIGCREGEDVGKVPAKKQYESPRHSSSSPVLAPL